MQTHFVFRQMESSNALRGYAEERLEKIKRYFADPLRISCTFSVDKIMHSASFDVTLLLSVAVGSYVVGRRGNGTNARHGMLSGGLTVLIFWAVTGRLWSLLALVPVAMAVGYYGARWGVARRA